MASTRTLGITRGAAGRRFIDKRYCGMPSTNHRDIS
jgi:hypothetical protein